MRVIKRRRGTRKLTSDQRLDLLHGPGFVYSPRPAFLSASERREAWELHREELIAEVSKRRPGDRPEAWWQFEAGRPEHLTEYPLDREAGITIEQHADAVDEYAIEPIRFVASRGELTLEELAALAERANEARLRVGTDAEQIGSGGVDKVDRRAVRLYEAVRTA